MEWMVTAREPGKTYLMQGNEAIVRGALEAGIRFAAAYPGSPSSEIMTMLGHVAHEMGLYAEWSTNENCAFQACMGASMGRIRSLCVVKQNGLLTIGDALHTAGLSGCWGGTVLVVADDPSAHSSTNEFDSRHQARAASIPLLEPATFQEAKDMIKYAFELSEKLQQVVMVRSVTRICHGRGNVTLGELPELLADPKPIGEWDKLLALNWFHDLMLGKLAQAEAAFEAAPFNQYVGPEEPELLIITSGTGWYYSLEAIDKLKLDDRVGILKLGCTWPLPEQLVVKHLQKTKRVLVVEEVDPFLEQNVANIIAHHPELNLNLSGRYQHKALPASFELSPDVVIASLSALMEVPYISPARGEVPADAVVNIPPRDLTFCAGCPHRASFFILKQTLRLRENAGVVMGDIGCYTLGGNRAGHFGLQALGCMGAGINMGEGLGQLTRFGFEHPVLAVAGDSTFFHSCLPGLINARYHNSDMLFVVLDNSATAMTGFQPHPEIAVNCMGDSANSISIEKVVEAIGCPVYVSDPYQIEETTRLVYDLTKKPGMKVLILRQPCATLSARQRGRRKVWVDTNICRGDDCGCGRFCSKTWNCPGNIWDEKAGKAKIDEVVCIGCGVCASLCPASAIKVEGGAC
ncbi:MAG: thiamine pyrophosphate-dependent enzyme [Methylocystaceae bacterium]